MLRMLLTSTAALDVRLNSIMDLTTNLTREQLLDFRSRDAARLVAAQVMAREKGVTTKEFFRDRWPRSASLSSIEKAAVPAAAPNGWGGTLAGNFPSDLIGALIAIAEPFSILPRLNLQRVPFQTPVTIDETDTSTLTFWRKGPGSSKILLQANFGTTTLHPRSVAAMTAVTKELTKFSRAGSEIYLRNLLARHLTRFVDRALLDPSITAVADASPASITNTGTAVTASGEPREDVLALLRQYVSAGGSVTTAKIAMSSENAVAWAALDPDQFKLGPQGGTAMGIPVVAGSGAGNVVALIDVGMTLLADDGEGNISTTEAGSLEMIDTSVSPHASSLTSMWQSNTVGILFERILNWEARGAVSYLERNYLTGGSPS